jgi:2'-5' RNA ligase
VSTRAARIAAAQERRVVIAGVKETGRLTTGQIDLEYRRLWDRAATQEEVTQVAFDMGIDYDDYDPDENQWVDAASEAFDLSNGDILSLEDDDADLANVIWQEYTNTVNDEDGDEPLDRFITHVGSALWPSTTRVAKTTGDGKSVGFFIPVPEELAGQFPSLGKEDTSPPHVTLLYVGEVPKAREAEFISIATTALSKQPGPVIASIGEPDFFVHPDKNRRVWYSRVTFSKDVAELRDRLWLALEDAGFKVAHSYPLAMFPHITLAYADGEAHEHSPWKGEVPGGAWSFDSLEVWGLSKNVEVFLGEFGGEEFEEVAHATVKSASTPVPPTGGDCKVLDQTADRVYWQAKSGSKTYWLITNYAGVIDQDAPLSGHQRGNYFRKRDGDAAWAQVKSAQRVASRWAAEEAQADSDGSYMSVTSLEALEAHAKKLRERIDNDTSLPDWAEAKITRSNADLLDVYEFVEHGGLDREQKQADKLPGGVGDKKSPSDFDPRQVNKGIRVEMEHTGDAEIALDIVKDHLTEDPRYYDKLEKIEKPVGSASGSRA